MDINLLRLIFFRKRFFYSFREIKALRLKKKERKKKKKIFLKTNDNNLNALK